MCQKTVEKVGFSPSCDSLALFVCKWSEMETHLFDTFITHPV